MTRARPVPRTQQRVSREKLVTNSDAYSVRRVTRCMDKAEPERSNLELAAFINVNVDVRRGRPLMHDDLRAGQFAQVPYAGAMVRVRMRVDHQLQRELMVREHG